MFVEIENRVKPLAEYAYGPFGAVGTEENRSRVQDTFNFLYLGLSSIIRTIRLLYHYSALLRCVALNK
jgi:hypothetical protein